MPQSAKHKGSNGSSGMPNNYSTFIYQPINNTNQQHHEHFEDKDDDQFYDIDN